MQRLFNASWRGYDRGLLRPRIVHLGLGVFFRAHGALNTEDVLHQRGGDWGIVGVSLRLWWTGSCLRYHQNGPVIRACPGRAKTRAG